MGRGRRVALVVVSTLSSVALAVAVNVATGGSLPSPLDEVQWLAWPLVVVLAGAAVAVGLWESDARPSDPGHVPTRPAELPPTDPRFAGREAELRTLLAAIPARPEVGLGAPVVLGVFGAGGIGKTALAVRLAHRVADRYPDGQVFVELRGASPEPADAAEVLWRLLQTLGVGPTDVPDDSSAREALLRSLLAHRRVLLLLDDAGTEDQVRPLLPAGRGCLVVVTGRPSLLGIGLTAVCDLDVLPEDDALKLLVLHLGEDRVRAEAEAAVEVVRHCGRLPLAVAVAAARLRTRPHWTIADLARRLADERRRLDELQVGHAGVRASIGLSYADLDPVAAQLFRRLALLGYAGFDAEVAAALLGADGRDGGSPLAERALDRLADAKLLEVSGFGRFHFHDLVRLFAQERLEAEETAEEREAALVRSVDHYIERTQVAWSWLQAPSTDQASRAEGERWFEHSRSAVVAAVTRAEAAGHPERAWRLAEAISPYLEARAHPADLAAVAQSAARAARRLGDDDALAMALRNLGQAERHRSRHDEALTAFTASLDLRKRLGRRGPVAEVLHRIGDSYMDLERHDEAEAAYLQAIELFHSLGQDDDAAHVQVALAANWLRDGRVAEAVEMAEAAVAKLGVEDPVIPLDRGGAWAVETLGTARKASGRVADARECHRRSLASFSSRGERYGMAYALLNLARCEAELGELTMAEDHYNESLRLFGEIGSTAGRHEADTELAALTHRPPAGKPRPSRSPSGGRGGI